MIRYPLVFIFVFVLLLAPASIPVAAQDDTLNGDWVGAVLLEDEPQMMFMEIAEEPAESHLLMAGEMRSYPISDYQWDGETLRFRAKIGEESFLFTGSRLEESFTGFMEGEEVSGRFFLAPLGYIENEYFDQFAGPYVLQGDRPIVVARGDDAGQLFYQDGNEQIRLYPTAAGRFLSSRGEYIFIERDNQGQVSALALRHALFPEMSSQGLAFPDQPYKEEDVQIETGDGILSGTLLYPDGEGPFPAILLLHGAGAGERHFYRVFADRFARLGFAALITDRRGSGLSLDDSDPSLSELAGDAAGWFSYLANEEMIDPNKIGLWAFSQGGRIAPMVAASSEDAGFIIAVSPTGMSIDKLALWLNDSRFGRDYAKFERGLSRRIIELQQEWNHLLHPELEDQAIDPAAYWESYDRPLLLIFGEDDQVIPLKESTALILDALGAADGLNQTAFTFPEANHDLMKIDPSAGASYVDGYLNLMDQWLSQTIIAGESFDPLETTPPPVSFVTAAENTPPEFYKPSPWYGRFVFQGVLYGLLLAAFGYTLFGSILSLTKNEPGEPESGSRRGWTEMAALMVSLLVILSLASLALYAWQIIRDGDAQTVFFYSLVILGLLAIGACLVYCVLLILVWRRSSWSAAEKSRHIVTLAASVLFLVFSLYWSFL